MTQTLEPIIVSDAEATAQHPRWSRALIVLVVLACGLLGGWLMAPRTDPGGAVRHVTPGASVLTERQLEMVDVVEQYLDGWRATDGDRVAAFMTENAYVEYPEEGVRVEVADGSLQHRISTGPYGTLENLDPMVVYEDRIVLTGRIDELSIPWLSVVRFTVVGDVKIVSETIYL